MSKIILSLIVFLIIGYSNCFSQCFEGKILYQCSFKSKNPKISDKQFEIFLGSEEAFFVKGGNYKTIRNGRFIKMLIYEKSTNKLYTQFSKSDTLFWKDCSIETDSILSYRIDKRQDTVLGVVCDVLIIETKSSKLKYFYNSKYCANPKDFKNHNYAHMSFCISKTKSLPLKSIIENKDLIAISEAIEITEQKLEDAFLKIPENLPVKEKQ